MRKFERPTERQADSALVNDIAAEVSRVRGQPLVGSEVAALVAYMRKYNWRSLGTTKKSQAVVKMAKGFIAHMSLRDEPIDIHEMLNNQIRDQPQRLEGFR